MSPEPQVLPESAETPTDPRAQAREETRVANLLTLEICFLALVGLVLVAAFFEALTYQLVSSRTPFVIMAPLAVLVVVQARRLYSVRDRANLKERLGSALHGRIEHLRSVYSISGWMALVLVLILVLGHFAGLLLFAFALMIKGDETRKTAAIIAVATTVVIYLVFEFLFDVELYRGLVLRYFMGYRDF